MMASSSSSPSHLSAASFLLCDDDYEYDDRDDGCVVIHDGKERFVRQKFSVAPKIYWHHIPFRFTECIPLGCTETHAFVALKDGHEHFVSCFPIEAINAPSPFMCAKKKIQFKSPWRLRLEGFADFLGGCAYLDNVCVITRSAVMLFNAFWETGMLNSEVRFSTLGSCDINSDFLVISGQLEKTKKNATVVFQWRVSATPIISNATPHRFGSMFLSVHCPDMLFASMLEGDVPVKAYRMRHPYEHPMGMMRVLGLPGEERDTPKWKVEFEQDMVLGRAALPVTIVKELGGSGMAHVYHNTAVGIFGDGNIRERILEEASIVDVGTLDHEITVIHDSSNSVHFYDRFERELYVLTNDSVMKPFASSMVSRERLFPASTHRSIGTYNDTESALPLILTAGALAVIKFGP